MKFQVVFEENPIRSGGLIPVQYMLGAEQERSFYNSTHESGMFNSRLKIGIFHSESWFTLTRLRENAKIFVHVQRMSWKTCRTAACSP